MRLYIQPDGGRNIFRRAQVAPEHYVVLDCDDFKINISRLALQFIRLPAERYAAAVQETARECICRVRGYDAEDYGGLEPEYYWTLCEYCGEVLDSEWFDAHNVQVVSNVSDWCEKLCKDFDFGYLRGVPDFIHRHIDFGGIAQDLFYNGDYTAVEYGNETIIYSE